MTLEQIKIEKPSSAPWVKKYNAKLVSADEAVKLIKSRDKIIVQPGCAAPLRLIDALVKRKEELSDVEVYHILVVGNLAWN